MSAIATAKRTMLELAYRQFVTEAYSGEAPNLHPEDGTRPALRTVYPVGGHLTRVVCHLSDVGGSTPAESIHVGHLARVAHNNSGHPAHRFMNTPTSTGRAFASFNTFSGWRANN